MKVSINVLFGSSTPEPACRGVPLRREPRAKEGEWNSPAGCFRSRTPEERKERGRTPEERKERVSELVAVFIASRFSISAVRDL